MKEPTLLERFEVKHLTADGTNYVLSAGTSDVNTGSVDCAGAEEVTFLVTLGAMAASSAVDVKLQESADNSTFADIAGTAQTQASPTDDDKMIGVTVVRPLKRYLRAVITRGDGGNSTIEAVHALVRKYRETPFTQAVTAGQFIAAPEKHISPVAGTA